MGYLHIDNLYKDTRVLDYFKELYAMEKIHGTSAHIAWNPEKKGSELTFFSGGAKHDDFVKLFDKDDLTKKILDNPRNLAGESFTIYGEAYGGKMQGMSKTYGKELKFVVFDVNVHGHWLNVPAAEEVAKYFGLDFVPYERIPATLEAVNAERDRPSRQAKKNGILEDMPAEGVVLRPVEEFNYPNGARAIAKHKRQEFMETKTFREVDPAKRIVLENAKKIAEEYVVDMRLTHVLDKLGNPTEMSDTGKVVRAMQEDVKREASGEIVWNDAVEKAIGKAAAMLFKKRISKIPV